MRSIDGDALLAEYDRVHEGPPGKARTLIENAPTIGLSCEDTVSRREVIELIENRVKHLMKDPVFRRKNVDRDFYGLIPGVYNLKPVRPAHAEPKTIRSKLNSMTDDEFAEWLCHQIFPDYDEDDVINVMRYQSVRNFLKMEIRAEDETDEAD